MVTRLGSSDNSKFGFTESNSLFAAKKFNKSTSVKGVHHYELIGSLQEKQLGICFDVRLRAQPAKQVQPDLQILKSAMNLGWVVLL